MAVEGYVAIGGGIGNQRQRLLVGRGRRGQREAREAVVEEETITTGEGVAGDLELMAIVAMLATKDGNGTSVATVEEVWQRDRGLRLRWLDCMKMAVRFWRRSYSGDG
ncbi:hypothetical protein GW17_00039143 [Ensete ventricosum]|nr:hypothetical protein GW17_00039143 [Ensete ventricosum]RZR77039.1 hypothetical protein BHM03_00002006 [Ensete ventricosum]